MTEEGKKIHAYWNTLVAIHHVLGKMSVVKAQKIEYDRIVELYGEEKLRKEFEL